MVLRIAQQGRGHIVISALQIQRHLEPWKIRYKWRVSGDYILVEGKENVVGDIDWVREGVATAAVAHSLSFDAISLCIKCEGKKCGTL